jgi:secreted trypsin-like serine protease
MGRIVQLFLLLLAGNSAVIGSEPEQQDNIFQLRIVGGSKAGIYPWFSLLGMEKGGDQISACGGSLLQPDIILTAAHCWNSNLIERIQAVVGFRSLKKSGKENVRNVTSFVMHPKFSKVTFRNDLMLLKLETPVTGVALVPISYTTPNNGDMVTAIGFGKTMENGQLPDELQEITVNVVNMKECNDGDSFDGLLDPLTQLCASSPGKDSCQGDSGGPLLNSNGKLVAINSVGSGCARPNFPGVYTKVSAFQQWIEATVCGMSDFVTTGCDGVAPLPTQKITAAPIRTPTVSPNRTPTTQTPTKQRQTVSPIPLPTVPPVPRNIPGRSETAPVIVASIALSRQKRAVAPRSRPPRGNPRVSRYASSAPGRGYEFDVP